MFSASSCIVDQLSLMLYLKNFYCCSAFEDSYFPSWGIESLFEGREGQLDG